jgi:pSer/pThr/pTyr-binding forkhead associated (FHA) protein
MTDETAIYLRVRGETRRVAGRGAVLGRSRSCDVQLDEQGVSRRHCEVLVRDDGVFVRDLGSTHGTWVDGRRVRTEDRLAAGATITLGARGPGVELASVLVHGRPILGDPAFVQPQDEPPTAPIQAQSPAPTPVAAKSRFLVGLAWGLAVGAAVGIAIVATIDVGG